MGPGEQGGGAKFLEGKMDDGSSRLGSEPLAPEPPPQMDPQLPHPAILIAGTQAAAADVLASGPEEYRPVLDTVLALAADLGMEPIENLLPRPGPPNAEPGGHLRVSPEAYPQRDVLLPPDGELQSFRLLGEREWVRRHTKRMGGGDHATIPRAPPAD